MYLYCKALCTFSLVIHNSAFQSSKHAHSGWWHEKFYSIENNAACILLLVSLILAGNWHYILYISKYTTGIGFKRKVNILGFLELMCSCGVVHYFNFWIAISRCLSTVSLNKQRGLRANYRSNHRLCRSWMYLQSSKGRVSACDFKKMK